MLRPTITAFLRQCLARANRRIVHLDAFGENVVLDAMRLLSPCPGPITAFDVGANVGSFSEEALQISSCSVHAFEPFPDAYKALSQLQGKYQDRFKAHNVALSDAEGRQRFYVNSQSVTNSLLANSADAINYQPPEFAKPVGHIDVTLDTVDAFCARNSIGHIHLLKTDTQGADLKVLRGAEQTIKAGKVSVVLSEVLFVNLYDGQSWFAEIYDWLAKYGYKFVNLYGIAHHHETNEAKWADALFVNPASLGLAKTQ